MKATAIANSNIALIKYWGMRDERLVLPENNSISFTMDDQLRTMTTVEFSEALERDMVMLDGNPAGEKEYARVTAFLDIIRRMAGIRHRATVVSMNSFPRAAGLASSASGFAALAAAAARAAHLRADSRRLSMLARRGSGSAARSVYGGAVEMLSGKKKDGSDCYAVQLSPPERWKDLRNIIAITSSHEKKISSMDAMRRTAGTSSLYRARLSSVGERLVLVRKAVRSGDFGMMAEAIMRESDNMHAVMLDSWPPIVYLNGASFHIMDKVRELNGGYTEPVAAYSFDAGPNAHVYTTARHEDTVEKALAEIEGIEYMIACKVGEGIRYPNRHLF